MRSREGGSEPRRAQRAPDRAGAAGRGSVQRGIRPGASSLEGRFNGLSFVGGCVCAPEDPGTPLWSSSPRAMFEWGRGCGDQRIGSKLTAAPQGGGIPASGPLAQRSRTPSRSPSSRVPRWEVCHAVSSRAGCELRLDATCKKRRVGEPAEALE